MLPQRLFASFFGAERAVPLDGDGNVWLGTMDEVTVRLERGRPWKLSRIESVRGEQKSYSRAFSLKPFALDFPGFAVVEERPGGAPFQRTNAGVCRFLGRRVREGGRTKVRDCLG
jgi:hypothetical protein